MSKNIKYVSSISRTALTQTDGRVCFVCVNDLERVVEG